MTRSLAIFILAIVAHLIVLELFDEGTNRAIIVVHLVLLELADVPSADDS